MRGKKVMEGGKEEEKSEKENWIDRRREEGKKYHYENEMRKRTKKISEKVRERGKEEE